MPLWHIGAGRGGSSMVATLAALLAQADFDLGELVAGDHDTVLHWVHSSDLADPSPFLSAGQVLLTTGRQFPDDDSDSDSDEFYDLYVDRLLGVGVVVVGFGTEVIRAGTPRALVEACRRASMPLVEVPYRTPFLAISQWVAAVQAADARERVEWASEAQNAISLAAIGRDGISSAIRKSAELLRSDIWLFDADSEVTVTAHPRGRTPQSLPADVAAEVARLLLAQRRARLDLTSTGVSTVIQTLGGADSLTGALVLRRSERFDPSAVSVGTTLVALAEVSLEHSQALRTSLRSLMDQLFILLTDGRVDQVQKAIVAIPAGMPGDILRLVRVELSSGDLALRDSLERHASDPDNRTFIVSTTESVTLMIEPPHWPALAALLSDREARVGISDPIGWDRLDLGVIQATRACDRSLPGHTTEFSDLVTDSFFGLLASEAVADIARARLSVVAAEPDGRKLLADAGVWLEHNAQWDPAARELGIHRHSLKARMEHLGTLVGLDLDRFRDRAELWALLSSMQAAEA